MADQPKSDDTKTKQPKNENNTQKTSTWSTFLKWFFIILMVIIGGTAFVMAIVANNNANDAKNNNNNNNNNGAYTGGNGEDANFNTVVSGSVSAEVVNIVKPNARNGTVDSTTLYSLPMVSGTAGQTMVVDANDTTKTTWSDSPLFNNVFPVGDVIDLIATGDVPFLTTSYIQQYQVSSLQLANNTTTAETQADASFDIKTPSNAAVGTVINVVNVGKSAFVIVDNANTAITTVDTASFVTLVQTSADKWYINNENK